MFRLLPRLGVQDACHGHALRKFHIWSAQQSSAARGGRWRRTLGAPVRHQAVMIFSSRLTRPMPRSLGIATVAAIQPESVAADPGKRPRLCSTGAWSRRLPGRPFRGPARTYIGEDLDRGLGQSHGLDSEILGAGRDPCISGTGLGR